MKKVNWAIIGLGNIAAKFAEDLLLVENAKLYAVSSRSEDNAKEFANKFLSETYFTSYEAMVQDPNIDIVYIATPHVFHFDHTMLCLENGKSVLCEKPFAMNSDETRIMIYEAEKRGLFLMEALWTQFLPGIEKVIEIVSSGRIGEIQRIDACFGFSAEEKKRDRLFCKELGGGSLLDIGIYPIYLSQLLLGTPVTLSASATFSTTAVDSSCNMTFQYEDAVANLTSTFLENLSNDAMIHGSKGSIKLHGNFHQVTKLTLTIGSEVEEYNLPYVGNGYYHEIVEVSDCLINGKMESNQYSLDKTLELVSTLDEVRGIIGLKYPCE